MNLTPNQIRTFFEYHHPGQTIGTRSKATVKCRFHDDSSPSCTLFLDGNGGFHCNGCGAKGNLFQFQARLGGISISEASAAVSKITGVLPERPSLNLGPAVACYDYRGDDGILLYQKRRYEPAGREKTFRLFRPGPSGDWSFGLDDPQGSEKTRRVLYNQHLIVAANTVAVCEGEKDANTLTEVDLYGGATFRVATTCNFDGAWNTGQRSKWLDAYSPYFTGKDTLIFVDNDASGEAWATSVAAGVYQFARRVRLIRLPDLFEKGDVSDWMRDHTRLELETFIETVVPWKPEVKEAGSMFQEVVAFAAEEIQPIRWLVENVVPTAGNGIICGDPKASKSYHATDLALALACGQSWLGIGVARRVRTALISREDSPGITQRRIANLIQGKPEYSEIKGWMIVNTRRHTTDFKVTNKIHLDMLIEELEEFEVEFCVLDVFRTIHDCEENDNDQIPRVLEKVNRIQNECNCAVALVHHLSKRDDHNIFRGLRGASAIHGWMEWGIGISVVNPEEDDKANFVRKLEFENKEGICSPVYSQLRETTRGMRIDVTVPPAQSKRASLGNYVRVAEQQANYQQAGNSSNPYQIK